MSFNGKPDEDLVVGWLNPHLDVHHGLKAVALSFIDASHKRLPERSDPTAG
jgi:hypothetical protein